MAQTQLKRHPVRAALWGFILGLGVFVYLTFVWPVIGLDNVASVALKAAAVVVGVMLLAILWGLFGPAKKPKGPAPATAAAAPPAPAEEPAPPAPAEETAPPDPAEEAATPPAEGE
jgi:hypothetical protein